MNSTVYLCRLSIVLLVSAFGSCVAWAQTTVFSAQASASRIGVQDQLQVDYTIQDVEDLRTISKPNFKDFEVIGGPFQRQSSNISIIGNKMVKSASYTHSYVLQPKRTGSLTIPPAVAKNAAGQVFQSNTLTVEVVNGSIASQQRRQGYDPFADAFDDPFAAIMQQRRQAMQQQMLRQQQQQQQLQPSASADAQPAEQPRLDNDLFIKVTVDKQKAYVGEQITASYKLYARIPMNVGISKLPSLNGFWTQDFDIPKGNIKPTEEVINGKKYQVFLLKKSALFPQQSGTLTLDPAEAEGTARVVTKVKQRNPFAGMFDDPFFQQSWGGSLLMSDPFFNDEFFSTMGYKDVPVKLKSTPVKINVVAVPGEGKPENYGGAVGNFTISSKVDKQKLTTDDALTYTLTISGSGNFKLVEAPKLVLPNGLNTYDPVVIDTITGRSNTITGSKIITYSISPNLPGDYTIPSVQFSYFNPENNSYTTLETTPEKVHVEKGRNYHPTITKRESLTDLHPIVQRPLSEFKPQSKPLFFTATYWSLYALPLVAFAGLAMWKRREDELSRDTVRLRNRRANKVALRRLAQAQKLLQQDAKRQFYEEVSKAIWLYLSDKLNIPLSSLSKERAYEMLEGKVPRPLLERMDQTITECETALYAPSSDRHQMQQTYKDAADIISKLEEHI